jgi:hypothetical protein
LNGEEIPVTAPLVWGHLELRRILGQWAFGVVYVAWDRSWHAKSRSSCCDARPRPSSNP